MADEKIRVDMTRHQRPYERGPQTIKNLETEFAREFPGEVVDAKGEARYEVIEQKLIELARKRKADKEKEDAGREP